MFEVGIVPKADIKNHLTLYIYSIFQKLILGHRCNESISSTVLDGIKYVSNSAVFNNFIIFYSSLKLLRCK